MIKPTWQIQRLFVLDCGKNSSTLYNPVTNMVTVISHEEVLNLHDTLPEGSTLVCEYSHLGYSRREKSLSQPFTAEELLGLYKDLKDNGITLKLFPQKSTPRVIGLVNELYKAKQIEVPSFVEIKRTVTVKNGKEIIKEKIPKSDINDPWAIWVFLDKNPQTSMANPPEKFSSEEDPDLFREAIYEYKEDTNHLCNVARTYGYTDKISNWIKGNIGYIHDNLSEDARGCFNFQKYKTGKSGQYEAGDIKVGKHGSWTLKMPQLFSIAATLIDEDGKDRVRKETQESPGWGYVKRHVLCMSPFHLKGGTARSTLYYHGAKSWISSRVDNQLGIQDTKKCARGGMVNTDNTKEGKKAFTTEQEDEFRTSRKIYSNSIREVFQLFKRMRVNNM